MLSDGLLSFTPGISQTLGTPNGAGGLSYASHFYAVDGLGNLRGMSDAGAQGFPDAYNWDAFGQLIGRAGGTSTPFGYGEGSGYQADGDSGLRLLGHRYYDSRTGRFISQDLAADGDNWYAYCDNDPLSRTDPTGLQGPPMSTVTTPHGQLEMAEIAAEAAEGIPKPVFPTSPVFTQMGKSAMGKVVIGWGATAGTAAADAIKAAINLRAADIMRMMNAGMTSAYARQLADFYYKQWQFMLQQNASNTAITVPLERFRLMELIAHRLEFIERIQNH